MSSAPVIILSLSDKERLLKRDCVLPSLICQRITPMIAMRSYISALIFEVIALFVTSTSKKWTSNCGLPWREPHCSCMAAGTILGMVLGMAYEVDGRWRHEMKSLGGPRMSALHTCI